MSGFASRRVLRGALVGVAIGVALGLGLFWRKIPVPATGRNLGALLAPEAPPAAPNSLAVLPFVNMTGDAANDYLGDGLAEELLHRLSRGARACSVAARRSAFAYKGKDVDVRDDRRSALGVNYVVEGSIRRQGGIVRVNAALVDRATGANHWSDSPTSPPETTSRSKTQIGTQVLAELERVLGIDAGAAPQPHAATSPPMTSTCRDSRTCAGRRARAASRRRSNFSGARSRTQADFAPRAGRALPDAGPALHSRARARARRSRARKPAHAAQSLDPTAYEVHEAVGSLPPRHRRRRGCRGRLPPGARDRTGVCRTR